ncbi:ATP-dependent DNA helicase RecG [Thalassoglobus sp.]|uniref:ATP-dependent DNA helicase RecG n=1 Tax=Thalassoglobus sp. TaxID=2795869 RepID=UPI003AA7DB42
MPELTLNTDVQFLPGVGPRWAELLRKLNVETIEDLLWTLPRDILDFSHVCPPEELKADKPQTVRGKVVDVDARLLRNNRTMTAALLDCSSDFVRGVWFNQPWMRNRLVEGQSVIFSGKPKFNQGRWEFSHPNVQWLDEDDSETGGVILTRYRLTDGLKVHKLRQIIGSGIESVIDQIPDPLPESFRARLKMPSLSKAIQSVHQPSSKDEYDAARRRIVFDDLFEFQLGLALRRRQWRARQNAPKFETTAKIDARIRRLFPFQLTDGQNLAIKDLSNDLRSGYAMHRLIQADVGAGKTVVAIYALLVAIAHGYQGALMAPTELLANQHWETLSELLGESRIEKELLTGSLTPKERQRVLDGLASGSIQLVVGTQALIQKGVSFEKLGMVIIDEQHKFGVAQRAQFSNDSGPPPHILVMTATPIPRTLCLTQFGDLDITIVKDRPKGRQPVVTSRISTSPQKRKAWEFLKEKLRSGRQMYIVCPLVDTSSKMEAASAEETFLKMKASLPDFKLGLVHGRIDREERNETMAAFRDHEIDVLVSTTVIEVGVDVPNATLMVILDAERFGLSQLHQLRGRIARGKHRGYCFLVSSSDSPESNARLAALENSSDGFVVAEQDFELRGPGDVLGTRQHGALPLRFADFLKDEKVLEQARKEAFHLVRSGDFDSPEFAKLKEKVLDRFSKLLDLPRSG